MELSEYLKETVKKVDTEEELYIKKRNEIFKLPYLNLNKFKALYGVVIPKLTLKRLMDDIEFFSSENAGEIKTVGITIYRIVESLWSYNDRIKPVYGYESIFIKKKKLWWFDENAYKHDSPYEDKNFIRIAFVNSTGEKTLFSIEYETLDEELELFLKNKGEIKEFHTTSKNTHAYLKVNVVTLDNHDLD